MSKTLDEVNLIEIVPDSISKDETVKAAADSIDPQLKAVTYAVGLPSIYYNFDTLTSAQLDHLAMQYDVTVWRESWPVTTKRAVLKTMIQDKRKKGTVAAVKDALSALGSAAILEEWWQTTPTGTPHTFKVFATQTEITGIIPADLQEDVIAAINDAKPLRSHYEFIVAQSFGSTLGVCGYIRPLVYSVVRSQPRTAVDAYGSIGIEAAGRVIIRSHLIGGA